MEPLAPIGGILVSDNVHRNIINKEQITSTFAGEQQLKGVKEPIKTYLVKVDEINKDQPVGARATQIDIPPVTMEPKSKSPVKVLWVLVVFMLLAIGYLLFRGSDESSSQTSVAEPERMAVTDDLEKTIAVLPLDNFSADKEENPVLV